MWLTKVTLVTVFFVPPLTTASTLGQRSPAGPPAAAAPAATATATATEPAEALLVPPQQQLTAPPQQDAMGLNARSFGAVGDGATDDTAALQAAIDEAQNSRRRLLVPAGRYLIRGTLYVRCYDSWPGACAPHNSSGPLRLTGEGMAYTSFVADNSGPSWPSEAVIKMSAGQGPNRANYTAGDKINHTNFHTLEHFSVAAQDPKTLTRRNYSILAPGLTRCMFSHVQCGGAAVAGMWASGWCNRVEHCRFSGNQVGLIMAEDANSNFVIDSAFEQNVGTALGIMEGEQMTVQGCTIEGNGGPGIVVASARGLLITGNYFEANNRAKPTLTPLDAKDNISNYNITSDIVFNGAYPPTGDPFTHLWHGYVSEAVSVTGNSFAPTTVGASGVMLAAVNGAVFSANIVLGHTAEQPGQDMALISSGMDPSSFFAQDVTLHRNVGWQHSSGPLSLLRPQLPPNPLNQSLDSAWMGDSGMHPHSFSVDSVEQRNLIGRKGCCHWASAHDLPPAPILTPRGEFDGRPVLAWIRPANLSSGEGATASIAWSAELAQSSWAGQLLYFAVRVSLPRNLTSGHLGLGLWIDPGTGHWVRSCATPPAQPSKHHVPGCLRRPTASDDKGTEGAWEVVSFAAQMAGSGLARFAVHVDEHTPSVGGGAGHGDDEQILIMAGDVEATGSSAGIDAAVVVAPVGAAWNNVQ